MKLFVYTGTRPSLSALHLARALGGKRIKTEDSRYRKRQDHVVINWGATASPFAVDINDTDAVGFCVNKLKFFQFVNSYDSGVITPDYTDDPQVATGWKNNGHSVVCRHTVTGHSGEGIEIVDLDEVILPKVPLYTKYTKKKEEFRVHVFADKVIHVQRKARKLEVPDADVNYRVRNLAGGFIYQINDIDVPDCVLEQALLATKAVCLDFGAVDIIWNKREGKAYVLEINTAPGLEGTTLTKYTEAINAFVQENF